MMITHLLVAIDTLFKARFKRGKIMGYKHLYLKN